MGIIQPGPILIKSDELARMGEGGGGFPFIKPYTIPTQRKTNLIKYPREIKMLQSAGHRILIRIENTGSKRSHYCKADWKHLLGKQGVQASLGRVDQALIFKRK